MLGVSGRKMGPLANGALCLSTPKHNGKSGQSNILAILWGEQVNFQ
jgi:hypothetical protein